MLVGSQDENFVNGSGMAIHDERLSVTKDEDNIEGLHFCDVCSTELINFFWRSKTSQSDVAEEMVDPINLCNSCFNNRGKHSTHYELRHTFSDVTQLKSLVKDIKNRAGQLF